MQLLLSTLAYERQRAALDAWRPAIDLVTIAGPDRFVNAGAQSAPAFVKPDIAWITFDLHEKGLFQPVMERVLDTPSRWIHLISAGLENPLYRDAMARGVRITKGHAQAGPIADYVLAHALATLLPLEAQADLQKRRVWQVTPFAEITDTHWLLIGFGSIGQLVAKRVKAFGGRVTGLRRSGEPHPLADRMLPPHDLRIALADADVVVLACALTAETRNLLDQTAFDAMKPGALLINVGRGGLLDEAALRNGLENDRPGRAILDVFATEPLPPDHWAWAHPKVRVTAHTSARGLRTTEHHDRDFLANLRRFCEGEALLNEARPSEVGL